MRHGHRISHDIDIFPENIQFLRRLSPRLNGLQVPYRETASVVRLEYGAHEVDFIASMQVLPYAAEDERLTVSGVAGFVRILRIRDAALRHALGRECLPDEYAAIHTGGYAAAPSFEEAAGTLRTYLDRARSR